MILQAAAGQEAIYHLAAQTAVTTSVTDPRPDFEINALGTFNVLEAARLAGHDPVFIYSSTNKVYGGMEDAPATELPTRYELEDYPNGVSEERPLDFHIPTGAARVRPISTSAIKPDLWSTVIVFRQSCIYGQRQMGVEDQGWVAWFVIAAVNGKPITIYGNGKQVRDLLHVDDLVRAFQMATEQIDVTKGQVYNLGGGPANTLSIWAEFGPLLKELTGREVVPAAWRDWRPGDQPVFVADVSKARREFGWAPR